MKGYTHCEHERLGNDTWIGESTLALIEQSRYSRPCLPEVALKLDTFIDFFDWIVQS
jgi:hypothetical protein